MKIAWEDMRQVWTWAAHRNSGRECGTPANFSFRDWTVLSLNRHKDIILKWSEAFSDRSATQLDSAAPSPLCMSLLQRNSCTAKSCNFYQVMILSDHSKRCFETVCGKPKLSKFISERNVFVAHALRTACSTCEAERTFSSRRSMNNYLRSTTTEGRLNPFYWLIHSAATEERNVERLMDVWIDRAAVRINTFR